MATPRTRTPRAAASRSAALHVELLHDADALTGPGAAVVDLLRTMAAIAAHRGEAVRVGWQWRQPDGRPGARSLPAGGRRTERPDVVVVPGWNARSGPHVDALVRRHRAALPRLRAAHERGATLLAVYTGVALPAAGGLLDGREAVVPWALAASVARQSTTMRIAAGVPWIAAGRVWTCASPSDTTAAMHALLRGTALGALADAAASVLLHSPARQALSDRIAAAASARLGPGALERARRHLEAHVDLPYDLGALARVAAMSTRSLLRHFQAAHGETPLRYLQRLRATRARMLLETTYLGVDAIAQACGYRDAAMLRRVFERDTGMLPAAYRERFRLRTRRRQWGVDLE